jgi:hypothetical protein
VALNGWAILVGGLHADRGHIREYPSAPSELNLRKTAREEGKNRGRLHYYFMVRPDLIFLADLYAKNEKENLTHAERNELQKIASEIQREFGG